MTTSTIVLVTVLAFEFGALLGWNAFYFLVYRKQIAQTKKMLNELIALVEKDEQPKRAGKILSPIQIKKLD